MLVTKKSKTEKPQKIKLNGLRILQPYLQLVKTASTENGLYFEVFERQEYEKVLEKKPLKDLLKGKGDLLKQDAVFIPCDDIQIFRYSIMIVVVRMSQGAVLCQNCSSGMKRLMSGATKIDCFLLG